MTTTAASPSIPTECVRGQRGDHEWTLPLSPASLDEVLMRAGGTRHRRRRTPQVSANGVGEKGARRVALRRLPRALVRALAPLTLPLRRYLLFEWFAAPDEYARRRASWPRWRRMVRPVAATLW